MRSYVVSLSDAAGFDCQSAIIVQDGASLSKVVQMAIDDAMVGLEMEDLEFPLFIDIHPSQRYGNVGWMHPPQQSLNDR